jgi:membrane associated rhomboid family serine protease
MSFGRRRAGEKLSGQTKDNQYLLPANRYPFDLMGQQGDPGMIETQCACGSWVRAGSAAIGSDVSCACGRRVEIAAGEAIADDAAVGDFDARLMVDQGPDRVGDTIALGGIADIEIGKYEGRHISLGGERVSRAHAKLVRLDFGPSRWKLVDTNSRNGVKVNGQRVTEAELNDGDTIRIGEFELRYVLLDGAPPPPSRTTPPPLPTARPPALVKPTISCPGCGAGYSGAALICTNCGINLKTGKLLITSKDLDENDLAIRADTWIRIVSILIWFGLFPIASEAFGTHKPRVTWMITAITTLVSAIVYVAMLGNQGQFTPGTRDLALWVGNADAGQKRLDAVKRELQEHPAPDVDGQREQLAKLERAAGMVAQQEHGQTGHFHWYQLLTNTLIHGGVLHLAGNLLFLLVFGLRVNELIGDAKMAIVYPLLAVFSGLAYLLAEQNAPVHAAIGASGAIMGLAGMYFVFFPLQKVYMAIWLRAGALSGWRVIYKVWRMSGVWLLLLWVAFNDILPTLLGGSDNVAHWAHLGGFVSGAVLAMLLMVSRQVDAHGADLLTLTFGRRVWAIIGTPAVRTVLAPA